MARIHDRVLDRAFDRDLDRDLVVVRCHNRAIYRDLDLDHVLDLDLDPDRYRAIYRDLDLDLDLVLNRAINLDSHLARDLARDFAQSHNSNYISWHLSLTLHLLPEAFADDLNHSFPAFGVCGLKGRAGDGWLIAPGWIEWDVDPVSAEVCRDSPKQQWSQPLIDKSYDLVFPLTNVPLGQLRRDCPEWRSNRSFRALGILAYFFLGSEEWLKKQGQKFLELFKVPSIHALMPKPELWLKRFDDWTETDWNTCGLSALWDIESGIVYWAEGAHNADDMKQIGKPIELFIASKKKQR